MARRSYTPEQKAMALARVLQGESISGVARDMGIERITLQQWLAREKDTVTAVVTADPGAQLQADIAQYMHEGLETLTSHAKHYRDESWVAEQTAETLLAVDRTIGSRVTAIIDRMAGHRSDDSDPV